LLTKDHALKISCIDNSKSKQDSKELFTLSSF
jgi:hypothetical protein